LIVVTRTNNSVTIEGHAQYAPHGKDIVCSAVSTLVQTLIQSIEDLCTDEISYHLQPGRVTIKHDTLTHDAQVLFDAFMIGVYMIANRYPFNVAVEKIT
jgi:uncharacterized protein YsxB (DUF464 family)